MSDYWCPTCCEWQQLDSPFFFTPRCEECGTSLEEDIPPEPVEIDFKEVDVSFAFQEDDAEDDADNDGDDDTEDDGDDDTEDAEADGESE